MAKINNRLIGENLPNLVTLLQSEKDTFQKLLRQSVSYNLTPPSRVTRFDEFSPKGRLFALGNLLKTTELARILVLLFPSVYIMY
jgi:hypothetical protein